VSIPIESDRCRLVAEHPLDRFDVASDGYGETGGGVTEIVNPKPGQIRVRLYEGPDSGQPDGPAESDERSGPPRGAVNTESS
jgi:hypothetical protein